MHHAPRTLSVFAVRSQFQHWHHTASKVEIEGQAINLTHVISKTEYVMMFDIWSKSHSSVAITLQASKKPTAGRVMLI